MAVRLLMYVHEVSLEGSTRHQCCWLPVGEGAGAGAEALGDFTPSPVSLLKREAEEWITQSQQLKKKNKKSMGSKI